VPAPADAFRAAYADAFGRYLAVADESTLRAAYELGRDAVEQELSVLDLAIVHHDLLAAALERGESEQIRRTTTAAASFFLESVSAFEMVRRGYRDARDAALAEHHHSALLRRLSSFLADASLAAGGRESHRELLQLIAEQALELIDAEFGVAAASVGGTEPIVAFAAAAGTQPRAVPDWVTTAVNQPPLLTPRRVSGTGATMMASGSASDAPRNALAAPLKALDGRPLGSVQLFNRRGGDFGDIDEAALVHLAELAAAALERTRLYTEASATTSGGSRL
jgi:GAF domain-containing protein